MTRVFGFTELFAGFVLGPTLYIIIWAISGIRNHRKPQTKYKFIVTLAYELLQFAFCLSALYERTLEFSFWLGCALLFAYPAIAYSHGDNLLNLLQLGISAGATILVAILQKLNDERSTRAAAWAIILGHIALGFLTIVRLYAELDVNGHRITCRNLHTTPFICSFVLLGLSIGSGVALFTETVNPTLDGDYVAYLLAFGMAMINNWILAGISMTITDVPTERTVVKNEEYGPISLGRLDHSEADDIVPPLSRRRDSENPRRNSETASIARLSDVDEI